MRRITMCNDHNVRCMTTHASSAKRGKLAARLNTSTLTLQMSSQSPCPRSGRPPCDQANAHCPCGFHTLNPRSPIAHGHSAVSRATPMPRPSAKPLHPRHSTCPEPKRPYHDHSIPHALTQCQRPHAHTMYHAPVLITPSPKGGTCRTGNPPCPCNSDATTQCDPCTPTPFPMHAHAFPIPTLRGATPTRTPLHTLPCPYPPQSETPTRGIRGATLARTPFHSLECPHPPYDKTPNTRNQMQPQALPWAMARWHDSHRLRNTQLELSAEQVICARSTPQQLHIPPPAGPPVTPPLQAPNDSLAPGLGWARVPWRVAPPLGMWLSVA